MAKVLVTGIAGGFGKPTALALLDRGQEVAGSVRNREGRNADTVAELEAAGTRIVEPGMIRTDFGGRSFDFAMHETLSDCAPTAEAMGRLFGKLAANPGAPEVVAEVIWQTVTEPGDRLRFRAGSDAEAMLEARKSEDDTTFISGIEELMRA